jgi:multidrug efflux pump
LPNLCSPADTVATPIEQEVNGVERMLYMSSRCTNDGQMTLDVTFELGTNLDTAQVLVQNRVSVAEAKLPEEVKRIGVTTKKKSPSILMCVNLVSKERPDGTPYYGPLYLSNFATLSIKDDLARVKGVGDVAFLGPRDYSMRVWLDPAKLAARQLTAGDVLNAIREQNRQVAAGRLGQSPVPASAPIQFQLPINTKGRLTSQEQFESIVVHTSEQGGVIYLRDLVVDVGAGGEEAVETGIELGAKNYDVNSYLDGKPSTTLAVYQMPGSNALSTAKSIKAKMEELKARFPKGDDGEPLVDYRIHYDTTVFIEESVNSVIHTLFEAFVLVFIVVLVFLQNWRATLIPMIAVPVSLIGTFACLAGLGFSLNNLSLFGLVLAIGIVVDDAIVVVENVERWLAEGLSPREASRKAMTEVTGPVIAIALVLCAVFVPTAFMAGISGQFYKQFALTIAASTVISAFNSLTLSPALAAILLKPHGHGGHGHTQPEALPRLGIAIIGGLIAILFLQAPVGRLVGVEVAAHGETGGEFAAAASPAAVWALRAVLLVVGGVAGWFLGMVINWILGILFRGFNWAFDVTIKAYGAMVGLLLRLAVIALVVYGGLMGLTVLGFRTVPVGFIPEQDKGYLVVNAQLPDGATLDRSDRLIRELGEIARKEAGVGHTIEVPGYSIVLGTNISNVGGIFVLLEPFEERAGDPEKSAPAILARLRGKFQALTQARASVFGAPPVEGLGSTGGFKLQVQDRRGAGLRSLQGAVENLADQGSQDRRFLGLISSFTVTQPQLRVEVDEEKARIQKVPLKVIDETLQTFLGSYYVNDFFFQNRNWQVNVQAAPAYRLDVDDIGNLEDRNAAGDRIPLRTLIRVKYDSGPAIVNHYNLYPSAEINGSPAPGVSSGQVISILNATATAALPSTMGYEWTELTLQEILAGEDLLTKLAFPLAVIFVLLVLAAQYESWSLPISIILIVPMCLLAAIAGVWLVRGDNNVFTQIGLVVLIGLAAKNAILIVEFAKQLQDQGKNRFDATVEACKLRLRPILMTSLAFILGVVPLVLATGAGAEMRFALGIAVFSGMLGVTLFGIFFTPVFYLTIRWLTERGAAPAAAQPGSSSPPAPKAGPVEAATPPHADDSKHR